MFEFLKQLDERLYVRYQTLERNIKAASNSFYDSFLDLQEQFIKFVIARFDIDASVRETCGALLKRDDVSAVFKGQLHIDDYTFNKMKDYTLKVNAHKHKGEKCIQVETVVSYMRVIYNAFSAYCDYKGIEHENFDGNYFINLFGVFERENVELKAQADSLKEELASSVEQHKLKERDIEEYRNLISLAQLEKLSLEEQNVELQRMISKLKDIKLSSMEEKLNKTIDLLLELKPAIEENRIIVKAVGSQVGGLINGDRNVDAWIEAERKKRSDK